MDGSGRIAENFIAHEYAVADIARELELGIGEVKLVIDLFQG